MTDFTDRAAVDVDVAEAAEQLGGIDVLVNNAGIGATGDIAANDDAEWARVLDVNVVGLARVSAAALPHLRRSSHAAIVITPDEVAHSIVCLASPLSASTTCTLLTVEGGMGSMRVPL